MADLEEMYQYYSHMQRVVNINPEFFSQVYRGWLTYCMDHKIEMRHVAEVRNRYNTNVMKAIKPKGEIGI